MPGTALVSMLLCTMLTGATMVLVTQYLQLVAGLTPLRAALWMLPAAAASTVSFQAAPLLARRIRPAYLISAGLIISISGLLLLTQVAAVDGLTAVVAGFVLTNLGAGPLVTLGTDLVVGFAPPERAGSAAAVSETNGEFGFALGIAVMGSVTTAVYRHLVTVPDGVPADLTALTRDTLAGATSAAAVLPGHVAAALLDAARGAFTSGLHAVATISAVLLAGVAILVVVQLRDIPSTAGYPTRSTPGPTDERKHDEQGHLA